MRYVQYGSTGKQVSVVGFGGMRFDTSRDDEENAELVRYACERGVNYFDTAPGYCQDKSEEIFGLAFRDMPGEFCVSTKAMPTSVDTAAKARDAVRTSLDRMGVAKIDFFHVWCLRRPEHYELAVKAGGLYDGLLRCRDEGLIEHIAFSSHQPGGEIKAIIDTGRFDGVLLGVNVLNFPYRWDGVQAADDARCGVVAMNPLGGGEIPRHEEQLRFLSRPGEPAAEAALRFVVGCPQINVALVGITRREHIDLACNVAETAEPFTKDELADVGRHVTSEMNTICTACGYCEGCPQNIPIPSYMQWYNDKVMFGKSDEEMVRSVSHHHNWGLLVGREADAGECIECGQCEEACTQHLNIIERLREIAGWERAAAEGKSV
jgi:hypothetical protein